MVKMLIEKPFIVVEISDSDRVILDIIKLCLPQGGGKGVRIKNGMSHVTVYIQIIINIVWNFCACSSNLILRKTVEGSRNVG